MCLAGLEWHGRRDAGRLMQMCGVAKSRVRAVSTWKLHPPRGAVGAVSTWKLGSLRQALAHRSQMNRRSMLFATRCRARDSPEPE